MTVIMLVFCLQAAPNSCTEQRPIEALSLQACLVRGQEYALEWLSGHPKWMLARWRCEQGVPQQQPA